MTHPIWAESEISRQRESEGRTGGGLACRCGSRNTEQRGRSALMRQCRDCGETYSYRVVEGALVPLAIETADALDEQRAGWRNA